MAEAGGREISEREQATVKEMAAIERSRNQMIATRSEIKEFVEPPLVDACEHFWDLNIRTLASSANSKDVGHGAYVIIDFNSLSGKNKAIVQEVGEASDEKYGVDSFTGEGGFYYDVDSGKFYLSEEHFRKATEK